MSRVKYTIRWSSKARTDLTEIAMFIAYDNPSSALKVLDELTALAESLKRFPTRGHRVPELTQFNIIQYLEINSSPWRMIYRINDDEVFILAIVDSRRNIEDVLLSRLHSMLDFR